MIPKSELAPDRLILKKKELVKWEIKWSNFIKANYITRTFIYEATMGHFYNQFVLAVVSGGDLLVIRPLDASTIGRVVIANSGHPFNMTRGLGFRPIKFSLSAFTPYSFQEYLDIDADSLCLTSEELNNGELL